MNNNTEVVFENIEARILKEIKDAHYSIFVSVAWFTNKRLFDALLEKAKSNCYVSIIIQLDEINSQCGIDYDQIQIDRSECFKISKETELLHDKFCVIDFQKVITGSYNWTYKASHNSENILILNDPSVAAQYITRFEQLKVKFDIGGSSVIPVNNPDHQQNSSNNNKSIPSSPIADTKLCSYSFCNKKIANNDIYCPHCGRLQDGLQHKKPDVYVTCNNCHQIQADAFIDVANTRHCTFCGSDKLEWIKL